MTPTVGQRCIWRYETRAGYGYVIPVAATVTRVTPKRVEIEVRRRRGGEWVPVRRWVKAEKLEAV